MKFSILTSISWTKIISNVNVFVCEEIMAENFPNLKKETDNQVEEAQRISNKMNPNKPTPRHTI